MSNEGQRLDWAHLVDEHAASLVVFARSRGLPEHVAQQLTGRVLCGYAKVTRPTDASPDLRSELLSAMLGEIERIQRADRPRPHLSRVNQLLGLTQVLRILPAIGSAGSSKVHGRV